MMMTRAPDDAARAISISLMAITLYGNSVRVGKHYCFRVIWFINGAEKTPYTDVGTKLQPLTHKVLSIYDSKWKFRFLQRLLDQTDSQHDYNRYVRTCWFHGIPRIPLDTIGYRLCIVTHVRVAGRIQFVCTSNWDLVGELTPLLLDDDTRKNACLALNNLSIPFENKAVMVFGPSSIALPNATLSVLLQGNPNRICLAS